MTASAGVPVPAVLLLAAFYAWPSAPAQAQEAKTDDADAPAAPTPSSARPLHRLVFTNRIGGRINPLGLAWRPRLSFERRLYESRSAVAANNYVSIGVNPTLSPAGARLGAFIEVQPLSILKLSATYEWLGYLGSFDLFQSFPGVTSEFSDDTLDTLAALPEGNPQRNYSTTGTQLTLGALLQAKVKSIAIRNTTNFGYVSMDLREGDRTFWDISYDLLSPNEGWFMVNDTDVLWVTNFGLVLGARWTATHAFYEDRHYAPGEEVGANPNSPHHRVGPIASYTFSDNGGNGWLDKPTVFIIVNWWVEHRYRTGAEQSTALPLTVLGFSFGGDLLQH